MTQKTIKHSQRAVYKWINQLNFSPYGLAGQFPSSHAHLQDSRIENFYILLHQKRFYLKEVEQK